MYIYKLTQNVNTSYDTYDSMIVIANNEDEAVQLSVSEYHGDSYSSWACLEDIDVTLIGTACDRYEEPIIILTSFNAG